MKEKLYRFMMGRYGGRDTLNKVLMWVYFILLFLSVFTRLQVLAWIAIALAVYSMFRVMSRNIAARQRENAFFFSLVYPAAKWLKLQKDRVRDRKKYRYRGMTLGASSSGL